MMKYAVLFFVLFSSLCMSAQCYEPFPPGLSRAVRSFYVSADSSQLFIAGSMRHIGDPDWLGIVYDTIYGLVRWDGEEFTPLGTATGPVPYDNFSCSPIGSVVEFNDALIVSGGLRSTDNEWIKGIAQLVDGEWTNLGQGLTGVSGTSASACAFLPYEGGLLVGGSFTYADTIYSPRLALWTGTEWLPSPIPFPLYEDEPGYICELFWHEGYLYATGNFRAQVDGQIFRDMIRYDGQEWSVPGIGIQGGLSDVKAVVIYQGELYVGGSFSTSQGNAGNKIMKLVNDEWVPVGGGIDGNSTDVMTMAVHDGYLYVGGAFYTVDGGLPATSLARWDGQQWCACGGYIDNRINALTSFEGDLIIGGGFRYTDDSVLTLSLAKLREEAVFVCNPPVFNEEVDFTDKDPFQAFPNPTTGKVTIKLPGGIDLNEKPIRFFNALGQVIDIPFTSFVNAKQLTFDLSGLPGGSYFFQIGSYSGQIIKILD